MGFVTGRTLSFKIMKLFRKRISPKTICDFRHRMGNKLTVFTINFTYLLALCKNHLFEKIDFKKINS